MLDESVFCLAYLAIAAFPDKHDKVFQETDLFYIQLFALYAERVHGDRILLGIADILPTNILTESFIRVTCIDHDHIGILLPKLTYYAIHVERLTATAWAKTEKVRVVGKLFLAFFSTDVNSYRYTLTVGVIDLQRCVLTLGHSLLIHHAASGITQCQKTVILCIQAITVAWKRVDKEFQLVIGTLADMNTNTTKGILQMVGTLLEVSISSCRNYEVEMAIDQLFVLPSYQFLHLLDVLHRNLIAWIGQGGMTVLFLGELAHLLLLIRNEDDLIEHNTLCAWYAVNK